MAVTMQSVLDAAEKSAPHWLQARRQEGRQRWQRTTWPGRRNEHWKYTSLKSLEQEFVPAGVDAGTGNADWAGLWPELDGPRLVFIEGRFAPALSDTTSVPGVRVTRFAAAGEQDAAEIQRLLGSAVSGEKHIFEPLNEAALEDGVFVDVAAEAAVAQPLHIIWISRSDQDVAAAQRLLVRAGAHSRAQIIETFVTTTDEVRTFTNGITELLLEEGARLAHSRLHLEQGQARHIGGVHANMAANTHLESFHCALGCALLRVDAVINFLGSGARANVNGVYLPSGGDHVDYHTCMEHAVPHCESDEVFRGIVGGEATAVFNGRIHIHPDAQKTKAELSNKNLLTSESAQVNTKPELEIYADDVQCAHGATVAQLDPEALYYMRTRGVPLEEAEVMVSYGFINELLEALETAPLRDFLRPRLAGRFTRDTELMRHIL